MELLLSSHLRGLALRGLCVAFLGAPLAAQYGSSPALDRKTYTSPSGAFTLTVDPTRRTGAGSGHYRLEHGGTVLWEREHPFTFREAVVTDHGVSTGFAYTSGPDNEGELLFAVLGDNGWLRGEQREARIPSRFEHTSPTPSAGSITIQEEADRAFLLVADPDINRKREVWWRLRISDGGLLNPIADPKATLAAEDYANSTVGARPIPGTPLLLCHWYANDAVRKPGAIFSIHDHEGAVLWELTLEGDYEQEDQTAKFQLLRRIWDDGAILGTGVKSFELWHARAGQRVSYDIRRKDETWEVVEVGREPYELPEKPTPQNRFNSRAFDATFLGWTEFETTQGPRPARGVLAWGIDDSNRIAAIKQPEKERPVPFVLHDEDGREVSSFDLNFLEPGSRADLQLLWLEGDRWLTTVPRYGGGNPDFVELYGVDANSGAQEQLAAWQGDRPKAMARRPGGGFVLLQGRNTVTAFGPDLAKTWSLRSDDPDEDAALKRPEDIAVLWTGQVVVLDHGELKVFDSEGTFLSIVQPKDIGIRARRLSQLFALPYGGLLVFDPKRGRTIHRLDEEFALLESLQLHYAGGALSHHLELHDIAPDGRWWGRDASSFISFRPSGEARHFVGLAPDPGLVNEVEEGGAFVDTRGNIYLLDRHTAVLHSLRIDGTTRWATRLPIPAGFRLEHIAVDEEGIVYLRESSASRCIRIDGQGQVLGELLRRRGPRGRAFIPGSTEEWVWRAGKLKRVDCEGDVLVSATKDPNGRWLRIASELQAAPDGSVAFIDEYAGQRPDRLIVLDKRATAKAVFDLSYLSAIDIAYDGETLVLLTRDSLVFVSLDGSPHRVAPLAKEYGRRGFLSPDGKEVWIHTEGEARIARFAVP